VGNTSFRGLCLGFDARVAAAYRVMLPILVQWFAPAFAAVAPARHRIEKELEE
jgi:hypothetical protein